MIDVPISAEVGFLAGGGGMGARMRALDWTATPHKRRKMATACCTRHAFKLYSRDRHRAVLSDTRATCGFVLHTSTRSFLIVGPYRTNRVVCGLKVAYERNSHHHIKSNGTQQRQRFSRQNPARRKQRGSIRGRNLEAPPRRTQFGMERGCGTLPAGRNIGRAFPLDSVENRGARIGDRPLRHYYRSGRAPDSALLSSPSRWSQRIFTH